jgi:hypothetical protein
MKNILLRWYNVEFKHKLNFPETFNTVPAHQSANRIWRMPMDYAEVARRLLGETVPVLTIQQRAFNKAFRTFWTSLSI